MAFGSLLRYAVLVSFSSFDGYGDVDVLSLEHFGGVP